MQPSVLIIGGGLAGLAAATALAPRGFRVRLIESRSRLGGRASSFHDSATGQLVDTCQHVSMGCCTNLAHFSRTIGVAHFLKPQPTLYFMTPDRRVSRFHADPLPAPLHLFRSFAFAHYLTLREKLSVAWGLLKLKSASVEDDPPFQDWLTKHGQTQRIVDRFWGLVLISALNETPDRIGLRYARKVFVDGFLKHRRGFEVEVPIVPLGRLYGEELSRWLSEHQVEVRLQHGGKRLNVSSERISELETRHGESLTADYFISALPFDRLLDLLGESPSPLPRHSGGKGPEVNSLHSQTIPSDSAPPHPNPLPPEYRGERGQDKLPTSIVDRYAYFSNLRNLETSPITGVHCWFDRPGTELPHIVLMDCIGQWLFNRGETSPGEWYLQVVVSAARQFRGLGHDEVERQIVAELRRLLPALADAKLLRARVVTEHAATFSAVPGVDRWRPTQTSPIANLFVAGDWTNTGWPATMEGAVRSGYLAAEALLRQLGRAEKLVQADLT